MRSTRYKRIDVYGTGEHCYWREIRTKCKILLIAVSKIVLSYINGKRQLSVRNDDDR